MGRKGSCNITLECMEESIPSTPTRSSRAIQQNLFSLLECCSTLKKLCQIHAQIVINGFTQKNYILVKLLSFYVASGYLKCALRVFEGIERPSATIWNQIIRGHAQSQTPRKAIELYNRMVTAEAEPDGFTYSYLLNACVRAELLREGEQVHGRVLANGYCSNLFVQTNLVNLYAVGEVNDIRYAQRVFEEMNDRSVVSWNSLLAGYIRCGDIDGGWRIFDEMPERNVVSWTTIISGCAQNGRYKRAVSLFGEMRKAHVEVDQVALVAVLSACAKLGDLNLGKQIHWYIEVRICARNQTVLVSLNNALIHMYASCGVIDEAYEVFNMMPCKSNISWNSIIMGLAKQGCGEKSLDVFQSMLRLGANQARPDETTFTGVLCACSHAGLVKEGRHLFKHMNITWGVSPKIEHYGCMVDLLSRAGFLDEAYRLVESMPIRPNDAVWGALLGGCRIHKNASLASHVAQKLAVGLDPEQAAGYLVLLSNVYATVKRWKDVLGVRQKMVEMGVRKPSGRSLVQINGVA